MYRKRLFYTSENSKRSFYLDYSSSCSYFSSNSRVFYTTEFEDTKGVIRIRVSKKNRQYNGQKKKYKRTNNDPQNIHIKLKIE